MNSKVKFRRVDSHKYSKLGVRRRNKQKYRKPTGRDNKIRLNLAGRLKKVKIGFRSAKETRGMVKQMEPIIIRNIEDLKKINEKAIGILGKVGNKKRKEIAEYVLKNNVKILNLNAKKFLESLESKQKETKEKQKIRETKRKSREKQTKGKKESKKEKNEMKDTEKKENKVEENKVEEKPTKEVKELKEKNKNESK